MSCQHRPEAIRFSLCTEDDDFTTISQKDDHYSKSFSALADLRRQGQLCDVKLLCDGRQFFAHKVVLAATIPYFRLMFTADMIESKQGEVTISQMESDCLEQLVSYGYTGELTISAGNVQSIMIGANFFQLNDVVEECSTFLLNRLHTSNVLSIRNFCVSLGCRSVVSITDMFIQKHFVAISQGDEYLALELEAVMEMLNQDNLYVANEEDVFNAALRWLLHDGERHKHAAKLLTCVRLHLLKPAFLSDRVASHKLIHSNLICRDLVDEAKDYHLIPERRHLHRSFKVKPRCCRHVPGIIFAIGGLTSNGEPSAVEMYDPLTKKWKSVRSMPSKRSRVGVAVYERKVYAIGGFDGAERLRLVESYDYVKNEWSRCSPLEKKRSALGAAFLQGKLYVCGGYDGITSLSSVEIYDPEQDVWTSGPNMIFQRSAAGAAVLDGYLYIMGGHDGMCIFNSVERYSIEKGTWELMPPMIDKRCRLGAAVLNGKIYVCGGYDGSQFLSSVECFDPTTNSWSPVTPLNIKRSRVAVVDNANSLYAVAGYDGTSNLSSMEIYSEETDEWQLAPPMSTHEGGVGVGVIFIPPSMLPQASE